jgi:predicted RNA-binding protein YlqC (UPF0109 family)
MGREPDPAELLVRRITEALCTKPEEIEIETSLDERGTLIQLHVGREDLGRIIGKGGENAQAIRLLLRALGSRHNARYGFKVAEKPYSVGP